MSGTTKQIRVETAEKRVYHLVSTKRRVVVARPSYIVRGPPLRRETQLFARIFYEVSDSADRRINDRNITAIARSFSRQYFFSAAGTELKKKYGNSSRFFAECPDANAVKA